MLGIFYNFQNWKWWIPEEKLDWVLIQLDELMRAESVTNGDMLRLNGKLAHYYPLTPGGKWWRTPLLYLSASDDRKSRVFVVTEEARECARWWTVRLLTLEKEYQLLR